MGMGEQIGQPRLDAVLDDQLIDPEVSRDNSVVRQASRTIVEDRGVIDARTQSMMSFFMVWLHAKVVERRRLEDSQADRSVVS